MPFQILCVYEDIDTSSVFINITDHCNKRLSTLENEINQLNKELAKNNNKIQQQEREIKKLEDKLILLNNSLQQQIIDNKIILIINLPNMGYSLLY